MLDANFKVQNAIDWETFLERLDDAMYNLYCDTENKDRLLCFDYEDIGRTSILDELFGGSWEYIADSDDKYMNAIHTHFKSQSSIDPNKPDRPKFWPGWEWPMDLRSPSDIIEEASREWASATNGELTIEWVHEDSAFVLSVETADGDGREQLGIIAGSRYSYPQTIAKTVCHNPLEFENALTSFLGRNSTKASARSLMMRQKAKTDLIS